MWKILPLPFLLLSLQLQPSSGEEYKSIYESIQNVTATLESVVELFGEENEFDIEKLAHLLKEFGPSLRALAPETQMIFIWIESRILTSVDTSLMTEKLKKINENFDKIENNVRASMQPSHYGTEHMSFNNSYWNYRGKIKELERRYKLYLAFPQPYTSSQLRRGCVTHNPVHALNAIHTKVAAPVLLPRLFPSVIAESGHDNRQLNVLAKLVTSDAVLSAYLSLMCLGIDLVYNYGSQHLTPPAIRADISSRQLVAISDALIGYQRDLQARLDVGSIPDVTVPRGNNKTMTPSASIAFAIGFAPMSLLQFIG